MRRVIVLRPEPGASQTIRRAQDYGLEAVAAPLFRVESLPWAPPEAGDFDALLLTSANAVHHGGEDLAKMRGLPVHAVGDSTAEAAREAGFRIASVGNAGVDRLLASIGPDVRLLQLCGEDRREPIHPRQRITAIPVYRAKPIDRPDLRAVSNAVVLIHSPRAGRHFANLVHERGSTVIAAISEAVANAVGSNWEAVEIADHPNDDALLALASRLCNISSLQ